MTRELGESGILFSVAFDLNWIINHFENDIFPKYKNENDNELRISKKFIRILKDRNTTYHYYKTIWNENHKYATALTITDVDATEYTCRFFFDKMLDIDSIHIWAESSWFYRNVILTDTIRNEIITELIIHGKAREQSERISIISNKK